MFEHKTKNLLVYRKSDSKKSKKIKEEFAYEF